MVYVTTQDVVGGEHDVRGGEVGGGDYGVGKRFFIFPALLRRRSPRVPRLALVHQNIDRAGLRVTHELAAPLG